MAVRKKARERTPERIAEVIARRGLTVSQRLAVHALVQTATPGQALELLNRNGVAIDRATLWRWRKSPAFRAARAAAEAVIADTITKHSVLRKSEAALETALTPQPILHKGEDTGFREVDIGTAARLIEMQGRAVGLFQDESATKVAVMIDIDFSGRKDLPPVAAVDVVDVPFEPVPAPTREELALPEGRSNGLPLGVTGVPLLKDDDSWLN